MTMEYQLTINKGSSVVQHNYTSKLSREDFLKVMAEEWMIDGDDELTIEILEPVA